MTVIRPLSGAGLILALTIGSGCGPATPDAPSPPPSTSNTVATAADLAFCVADINRFRALVGRTPLAQSAALEAFAAQGAQADTASGVPHSHFDGVNGGGVSTAENELLMMDRQLAPTIQDAMHAASTIFWAEGPGGGHYQHMAVRSRRLGAAYSAQQPR